VTRKAVGVSGVSCRGDTTTDNTVNGDVKRARTSLVQNLKCVSDFNSFCLLYSSWNSGVDPFMNSQERFFMLS
jgi:hypothetical protein